MAITKVLLQTKQAELMKIANLLRKNIPAIASIGDEEELGYIIRLAISKCTNESDIKSLKRMKRSVETIIGLHMYTCPLKKEKRNLRNVRQPDPWDQH